MLSSCRPRRYFEKRMGDVCSVDSSCSAVPVSEGSNLTSIIESCDVIVSLYLA